MRVAPCYASIHSFFRERNGVFRSSAYFASVPKQREDRSVVHGLWRRCISAHCCVLDDLIRIVSCSTHGKIVFCMPVRFKSVPVSVTPISQDLVLLLFHCSLCDWYACRVRVERAHTFCAAGACIKAVGVALPSVCAPPLSVSPYASPSHVSPSSLFGYASAKET